LITDRRVFRLVRTAHPTYLIIETISRSAQRSPQQWTRASGGVHLL